MKPECAATIFHVSDLESSVKYYTDVLGFTVDFQYGKLTGLQYDSVLIHLSGPGPNVLKKAVGEGHVYIFCDEVDQYFQEISAKGAFINVPPDDRDYGMRDFAISDPDGNALAFGKAT